MDMIFLDPQYVCWFAIWGKPTSLKHNLYKQCSSILDSVGVLTSPPPFFFPGST